MLQNEVVFSIARHAAWAPGITKHAHWAEWAQAPWPITFGEEPKVAAMPPMLRRRTGLLGRMALEVAYDCLGQDTGIPTVFCSRHGEVGRSVELLRDLARAEPLSPTAFGLAVHNANAGLFSIARSDRANHIALAAGPSTIEHAVIEACGLLADGAPNVLLVACDMPLPEVYAGFEDCAEQPYAFAWLLAPAGEQALRLAWSIDTQASTQAALPGGLELLRFAHSDAPSLTRVVRGRRWCWSRHAR